MSDKRFILTAELNPILSKHGISKSILPYVQVFLFAFQVKPKGQRYFSKKYLDAFLTYIGSTRITESLAANFTRTKEARAIIAAEKKDLASQVDQLTKSIIGLTIASFSELLGLDFETVEQWEKRGYIDLLPDSILLNSKTLFERLRWTM